jgi:hypothetical protein
MLRTWVLAISIIFLQEQLQVSVKHLFSIGTSSAVNFCKITLFQKWLLKVGLFQA